MTVYAWIVTGAWLVFMAVWLVSSLFAKRSARGGWSRPAFVFRAGIIVLVIAAIEYDHYLMRHGRTGLPVPSFGTSTADPVAGAAGAALALVGIFFAIYARYYLGRNWGMPMSMHEEPELVTTGPYALVRHPIYTGALLALVSTSFVLGWGWLLAALACFVYFIPSALVEERRMAEHFPDTYPAYKARTKMFIPYVL